jgi:hypothetical protein
MQREARNRGTRHANIIGLTALIPHSAALHAGYSQFSNHTACTSTTPGTALIAPAICGETL